MLLKDSPSFKEVCKIVAVGLALHSYASEIDGKQQRTSFGHEISRRIQLAANRKAAVKRYNRTSLRHRTLWHMTPERLKEYDIKNKKRVFEEKHELNKTVQDFVSNVNIKQ